MPKKTNIEINGSSYYRVTATVGKDSGGKTIRKQFYGSSKKEAESKRDEYMLNINRGLAYNFDKALFGHAFKAWFENVLKPAVSLSSYARYETDYRIRIKNCILSEMKLTEIKPIHVQAYYNGLLKAYTVNTVKFTHKLIGNFFSYCVKADLILKNPLLAVSLPKENAVSKTNKAIGDSDIEKLLQAAYDDIGNFIFTFAMFTGLRQGELFALTFKDTDLSNNMISVNKSVKYLKVDNKYKPVLSVTKTLYNVREIPILNAIQKLLRAHIRHEKEKYLGLGIPFSEDSILFSSSTCRYRETGNVRKQLRKLCGRIGIEAMTFHSLRHTFCTILAKQGASLKTASVLMGHGDIGLTAKIYTQIDNEELKKGIEKLSVYFDQLC